MPPQVNASDEEIPKEELVEKENVELVLKLELKEKLPEVTELKDKADESPKDVELLDEVEEELFDRHPHVNVSIPPVEITPQACPLGQVPLHCGLDCVPPHGPRDEELELFEDRVETNEEDCALEIVLETDVADDPPVSPPVVPPFVPPGFPPVAPPELPPTFPPSNPVLELLTHSGLGERTLTQMIPPPQIQLEQAESWQIPLPPERPWHQSSGFSWHPQTLLSTSWGYSHRSHCYKYCECMNCYHYNPNP